MNTDICSGFEQGPIRPPSEAGSLLLRVTRNCPWNKCRFCSIYKNETFSFRPVEQIIADIDMVADFVDRFLDVSHNGHIDRKKIDYIRETTGDDEMPVFHAAYNWLFYNRESVFLQDANSLILKPESLVSVLEHIRDRFPWVKRITSYARSNTISKISDDDLARIAGAGLNRIHVGMESASDKVLKFMKKGATKESHIAAGLKVKKAGMELSEYVMPGLGGKELSREHALETADALSQINPDFIRLRTLAIPKAAPLWEDLEAGSFTPCTDLEMAEEILLFLENLNEITSAVKSDHMLNLLEEVDGNWPTDRERVTGVVKSFLAMEPEERMFFQVGRRLGIFRFLGQMQDEGRLARVKEVCTQNGITPENVDSVIHELMKRFI